MDPISERHRPRYVRISFPKYTGDIPEIGHSIKTTAYVTPPQGPVESDGFDFRRHAYFQSLGRVGYARKWFERIDAPREQRFWKDRQRRLSNFIAEHMPERSLGFAQAIISEDRLNLTLRVFEDLRRTNLAHLLAISGLHMGLLMTVVFGLLRMICVIIPIGPHQMARQVHRCVWRDFGRGGLFATVGKFDCNTTCPCHDCLFLWRCGSVTARLNAAILGACRTYHIGTAARGALFPRVSNVVRGDHCIGQCV